MTGAAGLSYRLRMISTLRALALVVAGGLVVACPASDDKDDSSDSANDGGSSADSTPTTAADSAEDTATQAGGENLTWGAPCTTDAECVALIGEGGFCQTMAVIYELPGGYCTKPCALPDETTTVVQGDPACDPSGTIDCIGTQGFLEVCAKPCTDTAECDGRQLYQCQQMPMIAQPTDPSYCLMDTCCQQDCSSC